MGKKLKEHRKKVAKRNEAIKTAQKQFQKAQKDFLMQMIERERAAGKFDSTPITDPNQIISNTNVTPILTEQQGPIL